MVSACVAAGMMAACRNEQAIDDRSQELAQADATIVRWPAPVQAAIRAEGGVLTGASEKEEGAARYAVSIRKDSTVWMVLLSASGEVVLRKPLKELMRKGPWL